MNINNTLLILMITPLQKINKNIYYLVGETDWHVYTHAHCSTLSFIVSCVSVPIYLYYSCSPSVFTYWRTKKVVLDEDYIVLQYYMRSLRFIEQRKLSFIIWRPPHSSLISTRFGKNVYCLIVFLLSGNNICLRRLRTNQFRFLQCSGVFLTKFVVVIAVFAIQFYIILSFS